MIRAVLSVAIAVALLATSLPAIEEARTDRTEQQLELASDRIERGILSLAFEDDPTPPGDPGARRTVTVDLPERSLTTAPAHHFRIQESDKGDRDGAGAIVEYALPGRPPTERAIHDVDVRVVGENIDLQGTGQYRLVFTLDRPAGEREATVVVRRE